MPFGTNRKVVVHALVAVFCMAFLADGMPRPRVTTSGNSVLDQQYETVARRYGLDVNVLIEQGRQESGFKRFVISPVGAAGPAQFMPATARRFGLRVTGNPLTDERFDYVKSLDAQGRYMRDLLDRFKGRYDLALAGYNAGEYRASLNRGQIPNIPETRKYVSNILRRSQMPDTSIVANGTVKAGRIIQSSKFPIVRQGENGSGQGDASRPDIRVTRSVSWVGGKN